MPCIVPKCDPNDQCFALHFPQSYLLCQRWKQAIELGSGEPLPEDVDFLTAEVCQQHFEEVDDYGEPVIFNEGDLSSHNSEIRLSSCGLCLKFVHINEIVSNWEEIRLKGVKIVDLLQSAFKIDPKLSIDYFDGLCLQCLARLDVVATIKNELSENANISNRIVALAKAEKQMWFERTLPCGPTQNSITLPPTEASAIALEVELLDYKSIKTEIETNVLEEIDETAVSNSEENVNTAEEHTPIYQKSSENINTAPERSITHMKVSRKSDASQETNKKRNKVKRVKKPRKPYSCKNPNKIKEEKIYLRKLNNQKCYICIKVFESDTELHLHLIEHDIDVLICNVCNETCSSLITYNRHLSKHDCTERPLKCRYCLQRFSTNRTRKWHESCIHGVGEVRKQAKTETAFTCQHCGKSLHTKNALVEHEDAHMGVKKYKCAICGTSFNCRANMERHYRLHSSIKRMLCKICGAEFTLQSKYENHLKLGCQPSTRNICMFCSSTFIRHRNLVTHIVRHHSNEQLQFFKCKICDARFLDKYLYRNHMAYHDKKKPPDVTHAQERNLICSKCPQTFKSERSLHRHERFHRVQGSHKCGICDKTFFHLKSLENHKVIHASKSPFVCDHCGKRYSARSTMYKHRKECMQAVAVDE